MKRSNTFTVEAHTKQGEVLLLGKIESKGLAYIFAREMTKIYADARIVILKGKFVEAHVK